MTSGRATRRAAPDRQRRGRRLLATAAVLSVCIALAACNGDDDESAEPTAAPDSASVPTTTEPTPRTLSIVLTNDDGVGAIGIDLVATASLELDDVELTIVAPVADQSRASNKISDPPPDTATETTTASGLVALAVEGTPSDSVNYALDAVLDEPLHLVVSGSNEGQNVGSSRPRPAPSALRAPPAQEASRRSRSARVRSRRRTRHLPHD